MMDITRNQYFFLGLVLVLLGLECNLVETFVLTPEFTQFLAERTSHPMASVNATTQTLLQSDTPPGAKKLASAGVARLVAALYWQRADSA